MTGPCCVAVPVPHRLARRFSRVTASIVPAAVLAFLPKCPMCLAAWLTVATGVGFSEAGATSVLGGIVLLSVAAVAARSASAIARSRNSAKRKRDSPQP